LLQPDSAAPPTFAGSDILAETDVLAVSWQVNGGIGGLDGPTGSGPGAATRSRAGRRISGHDLTTFS
jgi:hypothetical protein